MSSFARIGALCLALLLAISRANAEEKKLRIAAVLGLTGNASIHSTAIREGILLAEQRLKDRGWSTDILWEDDQTDPKKTVSAFQAARARGYELYIGPTWSFQVNAIRPLIERSGGVAIIPAGESKTNGGPAPGIFNLCPSRERQAKPATEWVKKSGLKRGCIFTPHGDWGELHRTVFRKGLLDAGASVGLEQQFEYGASPQILQALLLQGKQRGCDSLFITSAAVEVAHLIKGRNQLHLPYPVLSTNDVRDAVSLGLLEEKDLSPDVYAISLGTGDSFRSEFERVYKRAPALYADRGYDALMILAEAVRKTDGSTAAVRSFLGTTLDINGGSGKIRFDEAGDVEDGGYEVTALRK